MKIQNIQSRRVIIVPFRWENRCLPLLLTVFLLLFAENNLFGQRRNRVYEAYIDTYCDLAVDQMKKYGIPASITLAQGLLESGAGKSDLSIRSNNHFGIKCHRGWTGEKVYTADDNPNDCFRKYRRVEDSYRDHSEFLTGTGRYAPLFELRVTDYKGWAKGLQQAGYATDRAYANKLIKIVEDYELYRFDDKKYRKGMNRSERKRERQQQALQVNWTHQPYITHGLVYIIAVNGDTFGSIAAEFGFTEEKLVAFNEATADFPLNEGDIVYFQKKRACADPSYAFHTVQVGESMHTISQLYGMRMRNLYRINKKSYQYIPEEGDILKLR